jgi:FdhD protein
MHMSDNSKIAQVNIKKISFDQQEEVTDVLAIEEPLEIQLATADASESSSIAVTMRTPGNDLELASGFLFTEGIIANAQQIKGHHLSKLDNRIVITIKENEAVSLKNTARNFYTTSSCGVCGKSSIDAIKTTSIFNTHDVDVQVSTEIIHHLDQEILQQQAVFSKTGGLHASALFDLDGNFLSLREDVGRHNALDKLIGSEFLKNSLPLSNKILLLSGRASFELIQKAWMAGIPIVAAVGAPSSLAVSLAKEVGITLIGFLRGDRFNIYSENQRICVGALNLK